MRGRFICQMLSTLPAFQASDQGRLVYDQQTKAAYYGSDIAWVKISDTIGGFASSQSPLPNTILVSLSSGKIDGNWIPDNFAELDVSQEWTRSQNFTPQSLTSGVSINWNLDNAQVATLNLAHSGVISFNGAKDGCTYILRVKQTGAFALTFGTGFLFSENEAPEITQEVDKIDIFTFVCFDGNLHGVVTPNFGA